MAEIIVWSPDLPSFQPITVEAGRDESGIRAAIRNLTDHGKPPWDGIDEETEYTLVVSNGHRIYVYFVTEAVDRGSNLITTTVEFRASVAQDQGSFQVGSKFRTGEAG